MRFWLSLAVVLVADQLSKYTVMHYLLPGESHNFINGFMLLTYVQNQGAAFGLLWGKVPFFLVLSAAMVAAMIIINKRFRLPALVQVVMGITTGGALGNMVDRVLYGYVVDMFDVGWWPVFNIADMGIVCGGILLAIFILADGKGMVRDG